uniref:Integrase catalytic domain-containing protein n=1 Tax=Cannabis sativa TaxID=3483 RepID=A0A803NLP6_CANSA
MVSEPFPPLMANMATVGNGGSNHQQGTQSAASRTQNHQEDGTVYFNHTVSIKLNDHNYLLWKQQILAAIRGNRLLWFIQDTDPPLSSSLMQILEFRTKLQKLKKGNSNLNDYLLKVKQHVDLLASVGEVLSDCDHIAAIFKGLPTLLLASESRIEKEDQESESSVHMAFTDQDPTMEAFFANTYRNGRYPTQTRDSGATTHCTPNGQNLMTPANCEGPDQLYVGNGTGLLVSQMGNSFILLDTCSKPLALNHSLHVPEITKNLLSVSKFEADNNVYFVFYPDFYFVKDQLVHYDLWGPSFTTSHNDYKYYIHFIDAYSRFTWLYLLKTKSDAIKAFHIFKTEVELQLGTKIKVFQSDWGGEYRSFTQSLQEAGIIHRKPCPTTHEQNGIAERKHRHIVENGLTLLAQANLPLKYWDEAFRTAIYLYNRLPTPVLSLKSPIEVLFNITPDYSSLKVFGCTCFPNIRPYNKHKLEYRSSPCTFIGYSLNHKGYKCLDPSGRLYISRDVIFDESTFPHQHLNSTTSQSHKQESGISSKIPISQCRYNVDLLFPTNATTDPPSFSITSASGDNVSVERDGDQNFQGTSTIAISRNLVPTMHAASPEPDSHSQSSAAIAPTPDTQSAPAPVPTAAASNNAPTAIIAHINSHSMQTRAKSGIKKPKVYLTTQVPTTLKQALQNLQWNNAMAEEILALKKNRTYTLIRHTPLSMTVILIYVDDIIITGSDPKLISYYTVALNAKFSLKDLGDLHYFLGIEVTSSSTGLHLSQAKYIKDLLHKADMDAAKPSNTPTVSNLKLSAYGSPPVDNPQQYRSVVRALQYLVITQPEISFSVNKILELTAFCDADWATDPDDRRLTSGFAIFFGSNPIALQCKKQNTVSRSSTEAEFRSLAQTVTELTWLHSLFIELHIQLPQPPVV